MRRLSYAVVALALLPGAPTLAQVSSSSVAAAPTAARSSTRAASRASSPEAATVLTAPPPAAPLVARPRPGGPNLVRVHRDARGFKLQVDGRDFMVFGMNWGYMPIGQNYSYDFWGRSDDFIEAALEPEMRLLQGMGVNAIRQYVGIPARWITYIYERYGIYTILNHAIGRYGHDIDGAWVAPTNYADPRTREVLRAELVQLVEDYKDTPGLLMWLLGNENNYGLYWASAEIEDLPVADQEDRRAVHLYSLFGEIIDDIKARDANHPVAIANGDVQFIDVIAEHCKNLDIFGSNVYRGRSSGDIFEVVRDKLGLPFMYTEFGADAYDAKRDREDDVAQAEYLVAQWQEIYEQSHGKGRVGNAIGGCTFQWSDGWWKYQQESNLDIHDTTASWSNGAYPHDHTEDGNNMNEEWFGICAKSPPDERGLYTVYPRTAYYALKQGCALDPYAESTTLERVRAHWSQVSVSALSTIYRAVSAEQRVGRLEMARISRFILDLSTFVTNGSNLDDTARSTDRFDHLQSLYVGVEVRPTESLRAEATINVLGNVPINPIDEIFYENRGRSRTLLDADGDPDLVLGLERIKLHQATASWSTKWMDVEAWYRSGHYHWGYEGDFFGIYPEANYPEGVDMFNANAPSGFVLTGKRAFGGLKLAFGPELYWGANPSLVAKYYRKSGGFEYALIHQEDVAQRADAATSSVIPLPKTRKSSAYLSYARGPVKLHVGALMAGTDRLGRRYTSARESESGPGYLDSGYDVLDDDIRLIDTLGAKAKATYIDGPLQLYVQGAYKGRVADGGADATITLTGFSLKESGQGNHYHVLAGGAYNVGYFQLAPNFLFQRPLEAALPNIPDLYDPDTGTYFGGVRPRSQLDAPFWVRSNRETLGFEFLLSFDPTPATWAWSWDNLFREDAIFAAFVDFVYRMQPTPQDSGVGVAAEGFVFAFPNGAPARDVWEVRARIISALSERTRLVVHGYGGTAQSTGSDLRKLRRGGADLRLIHDSLNLEAAVKINDWGPFDYHRDFNLSFPLQLMGDVSYSLGAPRWFVQAYTRIGVRTKFRTLDEFSPRIRDTSAAGTEWEIKTYVTISL